MQIATRRVGPIVVVTPRGRLSVETFGELKERIHHLTSNGDRRIVVNLSQIAHVDSIGVAELVRTHVILERQDGRLTISDLQDAVARILDLTRLSTVLAIYPTEADAIESYTGV